MMDEICERAASEVNGWVPRDTQINQKCSCQNRIVIHRRRCIHTYQSWAKCILRKCLLKKLLVIWWRIFWQQWLQWIWRKTEVTMMLWIVWWYFPPKIVDSHSSLLPLNSRVQSRPTLQQIGQLSRSLPARWQVGVDPPPHGAVAWSCGRSRCSSRDALSPSSGAVILPSPRCNTCFSLYPKYWRERWWYQQPPHRKKTYPTFVTISNKNSNNNDRKTELTVVLIITVPWGVTSFGKCFMKKDSNDCTFWWKFLKCVQGGSSGLMCIGPWIDYSVNP